MAVLYIACLLTFLVTSTAIPRSLAGKYISDLPRRALKIDRIRPRVVQTSIRSLRESILLLPVLVRPAPGCHGIEGQGFTA